MHRATLAALVFSLTSVPAGAQLRLGMRIRVYRSAVPGAVTGTLVAISADSLVVQATDGVQAIAAPTVHRVDVSQGIGHAGSRGAGVGAPIGAVAGVLWGVVAHQQCETRSTCFIEEPLPEIVVGGLFGAGVGAGVGYLIGMTRQRERWEQAGLFIAITPSRLQVVVRF